MAKRNPEKGGEKREGGIAPNNHSKETNASPADPLGCCAGRK